MRREVRFDPPDPPERIVVRWPGGTHDFVLVPQPCRPWLRADWRREGWFEVTGLVVEPEGVEHYQIRTLFAERIGPAEFRMLPARG